MTRSVSAGFTSHLALDVTKLATCVYIRRLDGQEFRFTDLDTNIVLPGSHLDSRGRNVAGTYLSAQGETPSTINASQELNVDNLEILTVLDNVAITELDMQNGVWDYADYAIFQVVHTDLSLGVMWLMAGKLGEVVITRTTEQGVVELRSKSASLQKVLGRIVSHECPTDLGAPDCRVLFKQTLWLPGTGYGVGHAVLPTIWEGRYFVCTTAGTTGGSEPSWRHPFGSTTTDGTVVWTTHSPTQAPTWVANRGRVLGEVVLPTAFIKRQYRCTVAGTSGSSEPGWDGNIPATTVDGSVTWTAEVAFFWQGTVTSVTSQTIFADSGLTDADPVFIDDFFKYGTITWKTGLNAGLSSEIKVSTKSTGTLELWVPAPFTIDTGDTFSVEAGCDKSIATCETKFDNVINFQGFPWVPGRDAVFMGPAQKSAETVVPPPPAPSISQYGGGTSPSGDYDDP